MKRDDPALAAGLEVERRAGYFGAAGLLGWLHHAPDSVPLDAVAVVCPPFGPEYTRSHRTLRHLSDRLARRGIPALRFDFPSIGDSAGTEAEPDLFERWRIAVVEAAGEARRLTGRRRVCLVGVRLGATLVAMAAEACGADVLVLWNPVVKGRAYVRELQAMALTAADAPHELGADGLEAAGFRVHAPTLEALKSVDLDAVALPRGARVRRLGRDDLPGWEGMMADHQFTVVPEAALEEIAGWVAAQVPVAERPALPAAPARDTLELEGLRETLCRFGPGGHLFGILAQPPARTGKPAVVLLNAGSIHHVGPHRLYVRLARELARLGHPVLRFDFEGIGDSVLRGDGRENHPYSPTAMRDLAAALAHLRADAGCERFVVMGLCSGAYNAFQAGLAIDEPGVERLVLVNPWYFHWREGLSLDTTIASHYEEVAGYKRSMRDPERWKRLLRGDVDVARLARVALAHVAKLARGRWDDLREMLSPACGTRLSQDIRAIGARGRRMHVILSEREPAAAILETEAARAVRRARRAGLFTLEHIPGGDHTFSRSGPREVLVRRVVEKLATP